MHPLVYIYFCFLIAVKTAIHFLWQCIAIVIVVSIVFFLVGCSSSRTHVAPEAARSTTLHFLGIPGVVALVGSSTPLDGSYSLTAAHVADAMPHLDVVARHPYCDIALIRHKNNADAVLMPAEIGETVTFSGYEAWTALPVQSVGTVLNEVRLPTADGRLSCPAYITSARISKGMSGGGVTNAAGELVGIAIGYRTDTGQAIFIPFTTIRHWVSVTIQEQTK